MNATTVRPIEVQIYFLKNSLNQRNYYEISQDNMEIFDEAKYSDGQLKMMVS